MSTSGPGQKVPAPRVVIASTARRDALIAIAIGLLVLTGVGIGIFSLSKVPGTPSTNQLSGLVVARHSRGEREEEISVGRKGLHSQETDSGYQLDVKTEPDGRIYEIPVPKVQYEMYPVGAKYKFIRPRSEQQ